MSSDQACEQTVADAQRLGGCLVGLLPLQETRRFFIQIHAAGRLHAGECLRVHRGLGGLRGIDLLSLAAKARDQRADAAGDAGRAVLQDPHVLRVRRDQGVAVIAGSAGVASDTEGIAGRRRTADLHLDRKSVV